MKDNRNDWMGVLIFYWLIKYGAIVGMVCGVIWIGLKILAYHG